jgi:ABC-type multidrug transport system fused ATPase/permease subunit
MKSLLRSPINLFYDVTPLGRILNRLSKDLNTLDEEIAFAIGSVIAQTCQTISSVLMTMIYFPYLLVFVPVILFPAKHIGYVYKRTSRELTRLESISRSPILNNFKQTLSGVKFIRSFNQVDNFIGKNHEIINLNTRLNYSLNACTVWMGICFGLLSAFLLSTLFFVGVLYGREISEGIVGLCLTYMIALPEDLTENILDYTHLENSMVAVERVKSYLNIPSEQPEDTSCDAKLVSWPMSPSISFNKVLMRYRPNTELVLKSLSFEIPAGSRVGITGRTGSGKSSIFLCLLRLVEITSGVISINDINIALVGLKKLRQSITLIPQDPLVFNGNIKENVDPLGRFDEKLIKKVLDEVGLKFGLDYDIKNSGQNISIGERQLLSLSRALLTNTKILLFDETTAGIDPEADLKIQNIIKNKFDGCTILTIAHRLKTIIENDLIVLLDDGKLKEIGSPQYLLSYDSDFKALTKGLH